MAAHGKVYRVGDNPPSSEFYESGKFGRLFGRLPPFAGDSPTLRSGLKALGALGGPMDAKDELTSDPKQLILDANLFKNNPDNPNMTAGMTFLGQFIDHDLTLDISSSLEQQVDPEMIQNFRTPTLGLDSIYGQGPAGSPYLYDQTVDHGQTQLLVVPIAGSEAHSRDGSVKYDMPRNVQGTPLIGDPRNDENLVLSQLHVAFLKFHNAVVEQVRAASPHLTPSEVFAEAQRLVRWHYQWIIVHEFLPLTVGQALVDSVLHDGCRHYNVRKRAYIPVEFSVAAYRFGHSQVRPSYRVNFGPSDAQQVFALLFNDGLAVNPVAEDMRGGIQGPHRFIDWQTFFDFGDGRARNNKRIDTRLSTVLMDLPGVPSAEPQSLASRNLLRHLTFRMPSGQAVARAMKVTPLSVEDLKELKPFNLEERTPLWFYVLKEAEVHADGKRLGEVGGRIVAEVMIGLLQADATSYLSQDPNWTPHLGATPDQFRMTDLLRVAGVVTAL